MARSKRGEASGSTPAAAESRRRKTYTEQFKVDAVARAQAAQSIAQVSRDLGVSRNTLTGWVRDAEAAAASASAAASGLLEAVRSGDRRAYLEAVRDQLAEAIDGGLAARDLPPNVRLLNETMRELEEMQTREREEAADAANAPDEDWDEDDI